MHDTRLDGRKPSQHTQTPDRSFAGFGIGSCCVNHKDAVIHLWGNFINQIRSDINTIRGFLHFSMKAPFALKPLAVALLGGLAASVCAQTPSVQPATQAHTKAQAPAQSPALTPEPTEQKAATAAQLPDVQVHAQREAASARVWDRQALDALPQSSRDLTAIVATHPAVRLNPTMDQAANAGSLAPEAFSVHGESPYQNQYLIDGAGATNVVAPHEDNLNLQVGNVPGFAQAYNVDTQLLEQVAVHDSRVPVQFGRFTGGVVDARIKSPEGSNRVGLRYRFNSSGLTEQKIADRLLSDALEGEPGHSAIWKKHFTSAWADMRLSQDSALLVNMSRRQSNIARVGKVLNQPASGIANGNTTALETRSQADRVDNLMAKLHTRWSQATTTALTLKRADRSERLVSNFFADTAWTNRQRATGLHGQLEHRAQGVGVFTATLSHDQMDALRTSSGTELVTQQFADRSLAQYTRGGLGTEALKQRQWGAALKLDAEPVRVGDVAHHLQAGVELQNTQAQFVRASDVLTYRAVRQANGTQRIFSQVQHRAGQVQASVHTTSVWASDSLRWSNAAGHWDWTLGLRLDHNNFLHHTNFAPRTRLDWERGGTQVGVGWARYWGMDLLGHALEEGKSGLRRQLIAANGTPVANPSGTVTRHSREGLRTPYSDEWALSVSQQLGSHWQAGLSVVHRSSRDGVTRTGSAAHGYRYINAGRGQSHTVGLSLRTLSAVQALGARWTAQADVSWQRARRNYDSTAAYEASATNPDDLIEYNGQHMRREQMPAQQFHQPLAASLGATARWQDAGLSWDNRIHWRGSRPTIAYVGLTGGTPRLERYASRRLGAHWSWDTAIHYKPTALRGASFSLEILNLTNRQAPIAAQNANAAANLRYQKGREIWLGAGFEF